MADDDLPTLSTLDELVDLLQREEAVYVRWSRGPGHDVSGRSRDELTGVPLPGLCASPLAVENWWGDRPLDVWVARRVYDYRHLAVQKPGVRAWVLEGREQGRGPDNEPLVECVRPIAWLSDEAVAEAERLIGAEPSPWGSLRRT